MANQTVYRLNGEQHKNVLTLLSSYVSLSSDRIGMREHLRRIDSQYLREVDRSVDYHRGKAAARRGDTTKFQNITIPVVLPQVEAAVTYQASVFLQGHPIFGAVSDPSNENEALQMDTIMGEHQVRGGWIDEILCSFRDGFKYNLMATEVTWDTETTFDLGNDEMSSEAVVQEVMWSGNKIKSLDLYNTILDPRVPPTKVAKEGDFAGYTELVSWTGLNRRFRDLGREDLTRAQGINAAGAIKPEAVVRERGSGFGFHYYFPQFRDDVLMMRQSGTQTSGWEAFIPNEPMPLDGIKQAYLNTVYQLTTMYCRIMPAQLGIKDVAGPNIPQVWKFVVLNGFHVIYAERLTNAHQYLPIIVSQPHHDKLNYQTKSLAENVIPFQEISTALANSTVHARRRAISDRMLYDPSRISASAINTDNPTARIAVKASAFGDDLSKAVYPIPFTDTLYQYNAADLQYFQAAANETTGQNRASQGQFVKGNKTRTEYVDIMTNARGRDHTVSLSLESTYFTPMKEILKSNILQYQGPTSFYNREERKKVQISPRDLRNAMLEFKVSDGLLPNDKLIDAESLAVVLQTLQASPELAMEYNVGPLFSYLVKSKGARIEPFEKSREQVAYEQAVGQWQQACAALAQAITSIKDLTFEQLKELQEELPPQPTPDQFGWNPDEVPRKQKKVSILESISAKANEDNGGGNDPSSMM